MTSTPPTTTTSQKRGITEVLPRQGLVYSEKSGLTEVLCKPKIMPIKSSSLVRLEEIRRESIATKSSPSTTSKTVTKASEETQQFMALF